MPQRGIIVHYCSILRPVALPPITRSDHEVILSSLPISLSLRHLKNKELSLHVRTDISGVRVASFEANFFTNYFFLK